jgi:hypothetical protein
MKIFFAFVITVLAHNSHAQQDWLGFRRVSELNYQFKAYAENSIVQLVNLGASPAADAVPIKVIDVDATPVTNRALLQAPASVRDYPLSSESIQIETCRKQGIKMCPIMGTVTNSTGFFDNGKIMYTCRHSYHNWFVHVLERNPHLTIDKLSPPILIYNKDGALLYNSATVSGENMLSLTFVNPASQLMRLRDNGSAIHGSAEQRLEQTSDIVEFTSRANIVLPQPVTFVTTVAVDADVHTYTPGYPGRTSMFGSTDARGFELVTSQGWLGLMSIVDWSVGTSNAIDSGGSGSPILDEQGRVYGIACAGTPSQNSDESDTIGVIINKPGLVDSWKFLLRQMERGL